MQKEQEHAQERQFKQWEQRGQKRGANRAPGDVAAMETDHVAMTEPLVQPTLAVPPLAPAPHVQGQPDLAATLKDLLAPMQQQLAQLAPMYAQLQTVALGLTEVTNKVTQLEEERANDDYESEGEVEEEDELSQEEVKNAGGEPLAVETNAKGSGRGRRSGAGNAANILNRNFRKQKER